MPHNLALDNFCYKEASKNQQLSWQEKEVRIGVLIINTNINNRLGKEWNYQLKD